LDQGQQVITLTNSHQRENEFGGRVPAFPFNFDKPEALVRSLEGVEVLYNTYWVRFNHKRFTHVDAVDNTMILFEAARKAGVGRIVHISITNPTEDSPLEYFSGKARLENALKASGLSYAILRPAVLFGKEDILINNIAWTLRHLPVFGVFGDGNYGIQPIYVDDLAALAVQEGESRVNALINAIGPETFTYRELVATIGRLIRAQRPIISVPPPVGYAVAWILGRIVGDVLVTRDEIEGLMANLLVVDTPPTGRTRLTEWVHEHAETLGRHYTSELARRKDLRSAYRSN
jgi:NADH dehydrogenase